MKKSPFSGERESAPPFLSLSLSLDPIQQEEKHTVEPTERTENFERRLGRPDVQRDQQLFFNTRDESAPFRERGVRFLRDRGCVELVRNLGSSRLESGNISMPRRGMNLIPIRKVQRQEEEEKEREKFCQKEKRKKKNVTISHDQTRIVQTFPVFKRVPHGLALLLVVVVLEKVPHDPILLRLLLERESQHDRVEPAPRDGVQREDPHDAPRRRRRDGKDRSRRQHPRQERIDQQEAEQEVASTANKKEGVKEKCQSNSPESSAERQRERVTGTDQNS